MMWKTLKALLPAVPSVSGREQNIAALLREMMTPLSDNVTSDALGNLICYKKGTKKDAPRVMLAAHMDEIGFIVTFIEENGFLRVAPMGGVALPAAAFSEVVFENGTRGVFVPEEGDKPEDKPRFEKCYIDVGAASGKEAARRVRVGDTCAVLPRLTRLSAHRVAGRPLDDRAGCACLVEIARALTAPQNDMYYVFSAQEEVGARGARPAAFAVEPDVALVFDVTATGDTPGAVPMAVKLGGGVAVKIKDRSVICHQGLVEELLTKAQECAIPVQSEILRAGGTDAASVQMTGRGARVGALSIPTRYIHTGVETLDLRDMRAAVDLALAYLGGKQ